MLSKVILWCFLLYFTSTSISKPLSEVLILKRDHAIKAASPNYELKLFLNTISNLEDAINNDTSSTVVSRIDFSSLESLVLCADVSSLTSCRPFDKSIMKYNVINDFISGPTIVTFHLFTPMNSREAITNPLEFDEESGQPYRFNLKEFEGVEFVRLSSGNIEIPVVPQNDITRKFRKHLNPLENRRTVLEKGQDTTTFGIQTLTTLFLGDFNATLVESYRDFALSLGARDLRMIMPKNHMIKCQESLGVHILCCDMDDQGQLNSCAPSTMDILILYTGKQKSTTAQSQLIQQLCGAVRGSIMTISDQPQAKVMSLLPNYIRIAENPSAGEPPANLLRPIDMEASSLYPFRTILYANISDRILTYVNTTSNEKASAIKRLTSSSHQQRVSSKLASSSIFSFEYGINTARLENVCLLNETTVIYFESPQSPFYGSAQLVDHLEKTNSGFFTNNPESAGWKFISNASFVLDIADTMPSELWFSGETAAVSPPYHNIFHHSQIMLPFIHIINNQNRRDYSWIRNLKRLILSTSSRNDNQWSLGLTKIILSAIKGVGSGKSVIDIHQQEDISMLHKLNEGSMLCFESLNIIGTNELSTPFISNDAERTLFDSYVDNYLGTTSLDQRNNRKAKQNEIEALVNPNHHLNITFLLRSNNRFILNLNDIFVMLNATGLVDPLKIHHRVYFFDDDILSAREQIRIMRETDILISPHGSGLQNMIYMRPQSAVIEVMTSPWYEAGYQCTALGLNLNYYVLPQSDINRSFSCIIPRHCLETPLMVQRRSLDCYGLRMCNAQVDVAALEILIWQAAQSVRIKKRELDRWRYISDQNENDGIHEYKKPYETPLTTARSK